MTVEHIPSIFNVIADSISRLDDKFHHTAAWLFQLTPSSQDLLSTLQISVGNMVLYIFKMKLYPARLSYYICTWEFLRTLNKYHVTKAVSGVVI